eukprot:353578-Chlamydomonas_euryale.AAC.8
MSPEQPCASSPPAVLRLAADTTTRPPLGYESTRLACVSKVTAYAQTSFAVEWGAGPPRQR